MRRPVFRLDARNVEPPPPGVLRSLRRPFGEDGENRASAPHDWPADAVFLIDTYELLAPLDAWLRDCSCRQPASSRVVIAGRHRRT